MSKIFEKSLEFNIHADEEMPKVRLRYLEPMIMRKLLVCVSGISDLELAPNCHLCPASIMCFQIMSYIDRKVNLEKLDDNIGGRKLANGRTSKKKAIIYTAGHGEGSGSHVADGGRKPCPNRSETVSITRGIEGDQAKVRRQWHKLVEELWPGTKTDWAKYKKEKRERVDDGGNGGTERDVAEWRDSEIDIENIAEDSTLHIS